MRWQRLPERQLSVSHLEPHETDLVCRWRQIGSHVEGDETCTRIDTLVTSVLQRLAVTDRGWSTLYRDPGDGRLWERTYPHGEMHGGGPARLSVVAPDDARRRYGIRDVAQ